MIYKFVPDIQIQWKDVWIGAALTSILFTIGKFLIGLYLGSSGVTSPYGAAGSLNYCSFVGLLFSIDLFIRCRVYEGLFRCIRIGRRCGRKRKNSPKSKQTRKKF